MKIIMEKLTWPVKQAQEDFKSWLLVNQNDLEDMDIKDMLFKAWLAARGIGSEASHEQVAVI